MNVTPSILAAHRLPRPPLALLALSALLMICIASAGLAAPPPGKGGGKDKSGGGGGDGASGGYQPEVRFQCRAKLDGLYSRVRPEVAADGTVYVVDTSKTLYAFDPANCVTKWKMADAGSKGLDVGPDGTIYTGTESWIKAVNPDGTVKWTFTQNPRAFILVDVAVGPQGYVYGVASSGMGVFALVDEGDKASVKWQTPEAYGRPIVTHSEIAISHDGDQLAFAANGHVKSVRTHDGETMFTLGGGLTPPRASTIDGSWHLSNTAHSTAGDLMWAFDGGAWMGYSTAAMGYDGTHYTIGQAQYLFAIDPFGVERWRADLNEPATQVDAAPNDAMLVLNAGGTNTHPAALQGVSAANGRTLWRMEFPADEYGRNQYVDTNVAFSSDSAMAYVVTAVASTDRSHPRAYLNAVATDPSLPNASTMLRAADIAMDTHSKRRSVNVSGTVTVLDENRAAVSGAAVSATWTLPDGSTQTQTVDTGGGGQASFKISGDGGMYRLKVTGISKPEYTFDEQHSVLEGVAIGY